MINQEIANSMLKEFDGCDSDNPGSPEFPAVWLFGIEPGLSKADEAFINIEGASKPIDNDYSIKAQFGYRPFNPKAFKLLAAMEGYRVEQYREFAEVNQPFVRSRNTGVNDKIYFKGNLYPYACNSVHEWPEDAQKETGISDKEEYRQWCRERRIPVVNQWFDKYQPKILIGVGIGCRNEFSLAAFGKAVAFKKKIITVKAHDKHIYYMIEESKKLVVVPHFSGPYGLNSNESLQLAGLFIAELLKI